MIDYLFRKPRFPVICIVDDWLVTAPSAASFEQRLAKIALNLDAKYNIIDSTGEHWELYSIQMYIMPTMRRKWSKKKIVQTYNQSRNCSQTGKPYAEKSLSSKRFEVIFADIVSLIEQSH